MIQSPMRKAPLFCAVAMLAVVSATASARDSKAVDPLAPATIQAALDSAYAQFKDLREGKNADYIPALAKVDSNIYGIAIVTPNGRVYTKGDISSEVSIQSISKVFTMAKVIEEQGAGAIEKRIGVDADRHAFQLDRIHRVCPEGVGRSGDQRAGESRRDHRDQHGQGQQPRRGMEQHSQFPFRLRRPPARHQQGGL